MMQSRVWADFPLKSKRCDAYFLSVQHISLH